MLETLVMTLHVISIPLSWGLFWLMVASSALRPLAILYIAFMCLDPRARDGAPLSSFQLWLRYSRWWKAFARWFPISLHRTARLPPCTIDGKATGVKYLFGYHPHGIIGMGAVGGIATEGAGWSTLFPGISVRLLTLGSNFWYPFYREYILAMGLAPVSMNSCVRLLENGQSICILIGGARESVLSVPGPSPTKLIVRSRRGFARVALKTGASLVPVIGFGEKSVYEQKYAGSPLHAWMIRVFGFTIPLFHARGLVSEHTGLLPYRRPIHIVVGEPIPVEKAPLTEANVDSVHNKYVEALTQLYETHRARFDGEPLEIVG